MKKDIMERRFLILSMARLDLEISEREDYVDKVVLSRPVEKQNRSGKYAMGKWAFTSIIARYGLKQNSG